jgi:hypothetical protein
MGIRINGKEINSMKDLKDSIESKGGSLEIKGDFVTGTRNKIVKGDSIEIKGEK